MNTTKNTKKSRTNKKPTQKKSLWSRHKRLWKWLIWIVGIFVVLIAAVWIAFQVSPWPNSLLIRYEFDKNGEKVSQALEKYVPANITSVDNLQYRQDDNDAYLDVFYPKETKKALPTIVWVHGGAWVSGNKDEVDNYLKILASKGFTTVGVNYSIAPEKQYPTPLHQVNDALGYVEEHAEHLNIDKNQIFLAGDSAGSQIVAQMGNIITNDAYAKLVGIQPEIEADKLKGMVLNCGAYDLALPDYNGPFGDFLHTVLWAYSGKKDFLDDPTIKPASVVNYVTSNFPPTFITAGNTDPLEDQSTEFAKKLESLGVHTDTLFYPQDHQPALSHEYQFVLDNADGKNALARIVAFLNQQTNK
jgi:acetyl esterase/lipase